ncbi:hypothetical protein MKY53_02665 [Macrococcus sp. FSL R5-0951]
MTYTTEQVITLIYNYKENFTVYTNLMKEYQDVVMGGSIAQYGIESTMPKPQGQTSNLVWNELQRLMKQDKMITKYENKVRYVQNRWDRIIDEKQAIAFNLKLNGKSNKIIAVTIGCDMRKVKKLLEEVAKIMTD